MIVATIVLIVAMLVMMPIPLNVTVLVDISNITADILVKIGLLRVFKLKVFIAGGKIAYTGTLNGYVDLGSKKSRVNISCVEWVRIESVAEVDATPDGLLTMGVVNAINGCLFALLGKNDICYVCDTVVSGQFAVKIDAKCKFSLVSLVGGVV